MERATAVGEAELAREAEAAVRVVPPVRAAAVGALIRTRRKAAGMSIELLAERAGLVKNTIVSVERGRHAPTPETLRRITAVPELGLSPSSVAEAAAPDAVPAHGPNTWWAPHYDALRLQNDMHESLNSLGGALEQTYLYLDGKSAADWISLATSEQHAARFRDTCPLGAVADRALARLGHRGLDVHALGPGDGRSETRLCQYLADAMPAPPDLQLYLLDISPVMLNVAFRHAADLLVRRRVAVFSVLGNFHEVGRIPCMAYRPAGAERRRLYTLLGWTVSNLADEVRFFRELGTCAAPGDCVALDVGCARAPSTDPAAIREAEPALRLGAPDTHYEWLSGPIRRHTRGAEEVRFRIDLIPHGLVPGSYELDWIAEVRMRDGSQREFLVLRGKRYDPGQLSAWLRTQGWSVELCERYGPPGARHMAMLLLRRL